MLSVCLAPMKEAKMPLNIEYHINLTSKVEKSGRNKVRVTVPACLSSLCCIGGTKCHLMLSRRQHSFVALMGLTCCTSHL